MTASLENYLFGHLSALANFTQKSNINEDVYEIFISYLLYFCLKNGVKNLFLNVMDVSFKVNSKFIIETCSLCYLSHDPYSTKGLNFLKTVCDREESLENMCILVKHLVYESHDYAYFMKTFDKVISLVDENHQTPLLSYVWMLRGIMHLKVFGYSQNNIINPRQYFVKSLEIDDKNDLAHYHLARVDSICLNTQSASQHLDNIRFLNYEPIGYFTVLLFTTTKNYKDALSIIENNRYDDSYRLLIASLKINYLLNRKQAVRLISKKLVKFVDKKSRFKSNDTFQFMADTIDTKRSADFTNLKNKTLLKDNKLSISMLSFDMQDSEETFNDAKYEEYCELAKIFLECNNVSYANFCLKKLEKTKPNAIEIIFIKALEAKIKMQNEKALQLFQQNLQLFPNDVQTMYHIGDLLIDSGRIVAARDCLEEAFRLENTNPNISKKLAFVYRKLGNIDSAKLYSSFSAQLSNSSPILDFKTTDLMIL
ncbi:MAG: Tetratricopeptide repeat protein 7A [Marteilia pararefringens]